MVDNRGARYSDNPIPLVKCREYPFIVLRMVAGFAPDYGADNETHADVIKLDGKSYRMYDRREQ